METTQTEKTSLANYVKATMTDKDLSGAEVEKRSQSRITQSYVNKLKTGKETNPTPQKLRALAVGLGVPEQELFDIVAGTAPGDSAAELLGYFNELPTSVQEDVLAMVKSLHQRYAPKK